MLNIYKNTWINPNSVSIIKINEYHQSYVNITFYLDSMMMDTVDSRDFANITEAENFLIESGFITMTLKEWFEKNNFKINIAEEIKEEPISINIEIKAAPKIGGNINDKETINKQTLVNISYKTVTITKQEEIVYTETFKDCNDLQMLSTIYTSLVIKKIVPNNLIVEI